VNGVLIVSILNISTLTGLWTRSLLVQPDGSRDETTAVAWLQGPSLYIDLRQPAGRPDFSHVRSLADLTATDCAWLATQQGFAGVLRQDGEFFEWVRELDFQPPAGPDAGRLFWHSGILVETGRYADYLEHWHRNPAALSPNGALRLLGPDGRPGMLVRTGDIFILARARHPDLPLTGTSLGECIAGAASLRDAQALLDCEISQGRITNNLWRITRSTLPFREGTLVIASITDKTLQLDGAPWRILAQEGTLGLY
jgi:hypothetical protein